MSEGKKQEAPVAQVPGGLGRGRAVRPSRGEGLLPSWCPHVLLGGTAVALFHPSTPTECPDTFELRGSRARSLVAGPSQRCPTRPSAAIPAWLCFWFLFSS